MWIVCITSVRHVLTVNGYGGRQTKENEKSWCFKGWETLVNKKSVLVRQATAYDPNPDIANEQEEAFMKAMRNDDFSIPFWN